MRCEEIDSYVYPYLDGEFDEPERVEFEDHVAACPACRRRVELEQWLVGQLRLHASRQPAAPPELRDRIRARLLAQADPPRPAAGFHMPGFLWKPLPGILGLGALAFFLWPMMGSSLDPVVEELVAEHERTGGVDVAGPEPSRLHRFYSKRLPVPVQLPRFHAGQTILLGGRMAHVGNLPTAQVVYDVAGEKVTLVVIPGDAGLWQDATPPPDQSWVIRDLHGHSVALYRKSGLTYGITSRMEPPRLQQMIQQAAFTP